MHFWSPEQWLGTTALEFHISAAAKSFEHIGSKEKFFKVAQTGGDKSTTFVLKSHLELTNCFFITKWFKWPRYVASVTQFN